MFLFPWGLIGLISVPVILLFYILKQKREKLTVSSLVLWQQVLRDLQARTPWQKLRNNLLMFLQILAALLLVMALAGFALHRTTLTRESVIILVDHSLSMSSTDIRPTRLEAAKKDAVQLVSGLSRDSRITVVSLGREAVVMLYASESRDEAIRSIQAIEPTYGYVDRVKAEELVLSLLKQDNQAQIVLFGDKPIRFGNETIQFSNYEKENSNLAIVRFTHTRAGNTITGLTMIRNQGEKEAEIAVSLYGDQNFLDSQRVTVPANRTQTIWWKDIPDTVHTLHCVIDTEDILMQDNHAYDIVFHQDPVKVLLVTQGNLFLERALSLIEGVELVRTLPEALTEYRGYGLYILDGTIPDKLPEDGNVVIFAPQPNSLFQVGGFMDTPQVRPANHPLFAFIHSLRFSIGRTRILDKPDWADTIMEYNGNPIIMEGQIQNTRILVFGFHLYETDLPLHTEFPIMISNIVSEYAPARGMRISRLTVGDSIQFSLQPDVAAASVLLPDGERVQIAPPMPPETFIQTHQPGIYLLEQKKASHTETTQFAVNLPDEWLAENREAGTIREDTSFKTHIPLQNPGYLLTLPLLLAVLFILIVEWWYYANRNYI